MTKIFLLTVLMAASGLQAQAQNPLAPRVLVVFDRHVKDSLNVANHYLASRGIAKSNLCAVTPPETVTQLTWLQYVSAIKTPIEKCLNLVGPNQVLYIVLSYVRPFSILGQNGKVYALDQYVADIWDEYSTTDANPYPKQTHPYFAVNRAQVDVYQRFLSFADYRAQPGALRIYSVWRLDGATVALANGMVDKALSAETKGLSGQACFDRQFGALTGVSDTRYGAYDWDLHWAATLAAQAGFSVTEDQNSQEFGTPPAPNCPNAAIYAGWYSLNHYNDAFTWNTGAIGFHLDSLSAMDPRGGTNWSANAIQKGITITSGAVSEPYLTALSHPDGVFLHLFRGGNVGDAFLRNTRWLKWMTVNIGDPLYRPFPGGLAPFNGQKPLSSLAIGSVCLESNVCEVFGNSSVSKSIRQATCPPATVPDRVGAGCSRTLRLDDSRR